MKNLLYILFGLTLLWGNSVYAADSKWATTSNTAIYPSGGPGTSVVVGGVGTSTNAGFQSLFTSYFSGKVYASSTLNFDSSLDNSSSPALWFDGGSSGASNAQIYLKAGSQELFFARDGVDVFSIDDDQLKIRSLGTVSEPTLSFNNGLSDNNQGFWWIATNIFGAGASTDVSGTTGKEFWRIDGPNLEMTFNEDGNATDYRFESDTDANNLVSDGGLNRVGIGTSTPWVKFAVQGVSSALGFVSTDATSTGANGWNLTSGCFAINGTCISGPALTGSGASNRATFWTTSSDLSFDDAFVWDNTTKRLGIGTTSPFAKLSIAGFKVEGTSLFAISTSTLTATTTVFQIDRAGNHIYDSPNQPTISSCGYSPQFINGNNTAGRIRIGAGIAVSCTLNFSQEYPVAPACWVQNETDGSNVFASSTPTTSVFRLGAGGAIDFSGDYLTYGCVGLAR